MSDFNSNNLLQGSIIDKCYVVTIYDNIEDQQLKSLCDNILELVNRSSINGVIFDLVNMNIVDTYCIELLFNTKKMITLLGSQVMWTGFQPGAVSTIMDLDIDITHISIGLNVETCIEKINESKR